MGRRGKTEVTGFRKPTVKGHDTGLQWSSFLDYNNTNVENTFGLRGGGLFGLRRHIPVEPRKEEVSI